MAELIEAVYRNGVFVPVGDPELLDHQRVQLTVEKIPDAMAASTEAARRSAGRFRIIRNVERVRGVLESKDNGINDC